MKTLVLVLTLALVACLGALAWQHSRHAALSARQDDAIASLQRRCAENQRTIQTLQGKVAAAERTRAAYSQARGLAARYRTTAAAKTALAVKR